MKKNNGNVYNFWNILISFLLIKLIIVICILIFYIRKVSQKNDVEKVKPQKEIIYIKEERKDTANNVNIYPKDLPIYNNSEYQQIGILTSKETEYEPIVLPLIAKKLRNNRDRWHYYTATDKNNMMRLPIVHENMDCDDSIGCKEIYDGDKIIVDIYQNRIFTDTIYKNRAPQYFSDQY